MIEQTSDPQNLIERIKRLEMVNSRLIQQRQRLRRACILGILIGAVPLSMGGVRLANSQKTIEAERLVLRDHDGRVRAEFDARDGAAGLVFLANNGKPRLILGVAADDSATVDFLDKEEKLRLELGLSPEGRAGLFVYGKDGDKPRIDLSVQPDGLPVQAFIDKNGKQRIGLSIAPENASSISIMDKDQHIIYHAP